MQNINVLTVRVSKTENFRKAIILYATKPHTINRQLAGAEQIGICKYRGALQNEIDKIDEHIRMHANVPAVNNIDFIRHLFDALHLSDQLDEIGKSELIDADNMSDSVIILNKLLPKNLKCHQNCAEFIHIDGNSASFLPLDRTSILSKAFKVEIVADNRIDGSGKLIATLLTDENRSSDCKAKLSNWIERTFLPKMQRWIEAGAGCQSDRQMNSLALVNLEEYNELYNRLKIKYGENMVKVSRWWLVPVCR